MMMQGEASVKMRFVSKRDFPRRSARARAAATLVISLSTWARAQSSSGAEPVRVVYRAPAACPAQAAFEGELAERLGTASVTRLDELARTLVVVIDGEPGAFHARVELVDRDGREASREVRAPTCDQAMRAIALVAALAVRSQAERSAQSTGTSATDAPSRTNSEPPRSAKQREDAKAATAPGARPVTATESTAALEGEVFAGVSVATGVGPGAAPGLLLGARFGMSGDTGRSIALFARVNDTFRRELAAADARFRLVEGRLELCPFEPLVTRSLRLSPCPGFEFGSHSGQSYEDGERVARSSTASRLWLAATLAARLRFRTDSLSVTFGPGLVLPITKNRFALSQPERPLYEVPDVAVGAETAIGFVW